LESITSVVNISAKEVPGGEKRSENEGSCEIIGTAKTIPINSYEIGDQPLKL